MPQTAFQETLGRNESSLFRKIYRHNGVVRQDLMRMQRLKTATFYNSVDALVQKGFIYTGPAERRGTLGRPTEALYVNPDKARIYGVFLTTFEYRFAILDFCGEILQQKRFVRGPESSGEEFLARCEESFRLLREETGLPIDRFCGIAVSATGPQDRENGDLLNEKWGRFALRAELAARFGLPVSLTTNANAVAWGLYMLGGPDITDDLAFIMLNEGGIGVGTVLNGKLFLLPRQPSPGISHMVVGPGNQRCQCGRYGCLHTFVGPPYVRRQVVDQIKMGRATTLSVRDPNDITFRQICEGAERGDPVCVWTMEDAARAFCLGVNNYLTVLPVPLVALGGTVVEQSPLFYKKVVEGMAGYAPDLILKKVTDYVRYAFRGISAQLVFSLLGDRN